MAGYREYAELNKHMNDGLDDDLDNIDHVDYISRYQLEHFGVGRVLECDGDEPEIMYVYMDIQTKIETLKVLLQQKTKKNLSNYEVWLQNVQMLEPFKTLVDQCVKGEGLVQVNAQILDGPKRINIADVVKPIEPTEEVEIAMESVNVGLDTDIVMNENDNGNSNESPDSITVASIGEDEETNQKFVNWVVDKKFLSVKKQYNIPDDPKNWTEAHIQIWLKWAINQFNLRLQESDWRMNGKQLCELTLPDFQKIIPRDPGNKFWTHLELLRKCQFIAIPGDLNSATEDDKEVITNEHFRDKPIKQTKVIGALDASGIEMLSLSNRSNRTGNNGQIQLWQFLLELLTDKKHRSIIEWHGNFGEFKLVESDRVAELWGNRKKKPTMNYEKMSRGLRHRGQIV